MYIYPIGSISLENPNKYGWAGYTHEDSSCFCFLSDSYSCFKSQLQSCLPLESSSWLHRLTPPLLQSHLSIGVNKMLDS